MFVLKLDVPEEEISEMESQAHARGFDTLGDYRVALVKSDGVEDIDHSPEEVAESLRDRLEIHRADKSRPYRTSCDAILNTHHQKFCRGDACAPAVNKR